MYKAVATIVRNKNRPVRGRHMRGTWEACERHMRKHETFSRTYCARGKEKGSLGQ